MRLTRLEREALADLRRTGALSDYFSIQSYSYADDSGAELVNVEPIKPALIETSTDRVPRANTEGRLMLELRTRGLLGPFNQS